MPLVLLSVHLAELCESVTHLSEEEENDCQQV